MEIKCNKTSIETNDGVIFGIGARIRIQFEAKQPEFPYSGNGMIGIINSFNNDGIMLNNNTYGLTFVYFSRIFLMKHISDFENFENTPFYNDEEKKFWLTHWMTKDGIKKKTKEEIEMLENFFKNNP